MPLLGKQQQAVLQGNHRMTIFQSEYPRVRVHTYVSPPDGWLVNTQVVEGPKSLVIFDGQLLNTHAAEVADYVGHLEKPVERIVVSHGHPDDWAGLEVLAQRFPSAPISALPGVAEQIRAYGAIALAGLRSIYGDRIAARPTIPNETLTLGNQTIAGVSFEFRELRDVESDLQLLALMPDQRVMFAFDLIFPAEDHLFTLAGHFDHWISTLDDLKETDGYNKILMGHDVPTDQPGVEGTIAYLRKAKECYAAANDGKSYAEALKAAFPNRLQPGWVDFSGQMLFRTPRPLGART